MKHRGRRGRRARLFSGALRDPRSLPDWAAGKWSWGPDPFRATMFNLLAPGLLCAGALGGMGWSWWQRLLAGAGALLLLTYLVLAAVGGLRRLRRRP
ncbi:hypothetical protein ACH4SP_29310 [Streptomyces sp. NPDC021093]|uniref:hypothetical protein n=1 Tax=Streptomyces sp. NPDC021093 TaxID=3365112 RepID=UPI003798CDD0